MSDYPKCYFNSATGIFKRIANADEDDRFSHHTGIGNWRKAKLSEYWDAVENTWRQTAGTFYDQGLESHAKVAIGHADTAKQNAEAARVAEAVTVENPWPEGFRVTGPNSDGEVWLHYSDDEGAACGVCIGQAASQYRSSRIANAMLNAKKRAD